jgi:transposase
MMFAADDWLLGSNQARIKAMSYESSSQTIATLGIDVGKSIFHLIRLNRQGAVLLRQKLTRRQLAVRFSNLPLCVVGLEAGAGAHHLGRTLKELGHDVRLMSATYVRPYLKGHKNDFRDAEAAAEAVQRPTMKFVALKSVEQLDLQALHRVRERLVCQRTGVITKSERLRSNGVSPSGRGRRLYGPNYGSCFLTATSFLPG